MQCCGSAFVFYRFGSGSWNFLQSGSGIRISVPGSQSGFWIWIRIQPGDLNSDPPDPDPQYCRYICTPDPVNMGRNLLYSNICSVQAQLFVYTDWINCTYNVCIYLNPQVLIHFVTWILNYRNPWDQLLVQWPVDDSKKHLANLYPFNNLWWARWETIRCQIQNGWPNKYLPNFFNCTFFFF